MSCLKAISLLFIILASVSCQNPNSSDPPKNSNTSEIFEFLERKSKEIFEKASGNLADASESHSLADTVSSLNDFNGDLQKLMAEFQQKYDLKPPPSKLRKAGAKSELSQLSQNLELQHKLNSNISDQIEKEHKHNKEREKWRQRMNHSNETWNATQEMHKKIILGPLERTLYTDADVTDWKAKGSQVQGYMSTCLNAFLKNIPPSFCYKKGADFGRIPSECPDGMEKRAALCFDPCGSGYYHFGGVCWQACGSYKDIGLICSKGFLDWFWKKSYIPHSISFLSDNVVCKDGEYKAGALCYRDCKKNGMVNCGIGACALSGAACAKGILEIAFDFICGLGELVLFIVSFGASSAATESANAAKAAKTTLATAVKTAGKEAMNAAFNTVKTWITNFTKQNLVKFILAKAKELLAGKVISTVIDKACSAIGEYVWGEVSTKDQPTLDIQIDQNDSTSSTTDKIPIWGQCSKIDTSNGSPNDEIACAKDILKTIGMVDPTGIAAMAAAFLQPVCDI